MLADDACHHRAFVAIIERFGLLQRLYIAEISINSMSTVDINQIFLKCNLQQGAKSCSFLRLYEYGYRPILPFYLSMPLSWKRADYRQLLRQFDRNKYCTSRRPRTDA